MHAFIISGGTPDDRQQKISELLADWEVAKFDQINLGLVENSIGIKEIRDLTSRLSLRPFASKVTAAIISQAEALTLEAQQALLKTLEEPPQEARIILETGNLNALIPTIISRCQIINLLTNSNFLTNDTNQKLSSITLSCIDTLKRLAAAEIGERLKIIDVIATRRDLTLSWIDQTILVLRELLVSLNDPPAPYQELGKLLPQNQLLRLIKNLLTARQTINSNVNPKLVLDGVFTRI